MKLDWLKEIIGEAYTEEMDGKAASAIGTRFVSKDDFNTVNTAKKNLEGEVANLKESLDHGEDFKKKFEDLEQKIADEKAAAEEERKATEKEKELSGRFSAVVGEQKWRDELTEKAVYSEFKNALADEANKGKGDKDILEGLTKDKGYFALSDDKKPSFLSGTGSSGTGGTDDAAVRAVMGLPPVSK